MLLGPSNEVKEILSQTDAPSGPTEGKDTMTGFTPPTPPGSLPAMHVLGAPQIRRHIEADRPAVMDVVKDAYLAHHRGNTSNPHSTFLRFPNQPRDRIIALPAHIEDGSPVSGIKWIASFPENPAKGIPRASAVMVLNDESTGYATTLMEASVISSARTAASGVLAAELLIGDRTARRIAIIGAGLIARQVVDFLRDLRWQVEEVVVHDLDPSRAVALAERIRSTTLVGAAPATAPTAADAIRDSDLVIFTTVASTPYLEDASLFQHHPVVLHLSLRDLGPDVIESAENFTDDVDHAVRERTSLELAAIRHRDRVGPVPNEDLPFIAGTIGHLLEGTRTRTAGKTVIFSPFGLGVLDLAVARWVNESLPGGGIRVDGFYDTLADH